jgi:hypothetical protein
MSENCQIDQQLCDIFIGNAIPFSFKFGTDEEPEDISGIKIYFTMKLNRESDDLKPGDLQHDVTFPEGGDSLTGDGEMLVPSEKTLLLSKDVEYFYDFRIIDNGNPFTIGSGKVYVKLGSTKAVI